MIINNKYDIGQIVFLITDPEQLPRIVTRLIVNMNTVLYDLSCGMEMSAHYDFEMSEEKTIVV